MVGGVVQIVVDGRLQGPELGDFERHGATGQALDPLEHLGTAARVLVGMDTHLGVGSVAEQHIHLILEGGRVCVVTVVIVIEADAEDVGGYGARHTSSEMVACLGLCSEGEGRTASVVGLSGRNNGSLDVKGAAGGVHEEDGVIGIVAIGRLDRLGADLGSAGAVRVHVHPVAAVPRRLQGRMGVTGYLPHIQVRSRLRKGGYNGLDALGGTVTVHDVVGFAVLAVHRVVGIALGVVGGGVRGDEVLPRGKAGRASGILGEHADGRIVRGDIALELACRIEGQCGAWSGACLDTCPEVRRGA